MSIKKALKIFANFSAFEWSRESKDIRDKLKNAYNEYIDVHNVIDDLYISSGGEETPEIIEQIKRMKFLKATIDNLKSLLPSEL